MEKVIHNSPETNAIRQRMEEVRCDLDEDVQEIVEGARDMGKWRYYVRTYPWICLGAALAAGYLIVPPIRGVPSDAQMFEPTPPRGSARGILRTFLGNLVMRGVSAYVGQQADKLFATQVARPPQDDQP